MISIHLCNSSARETKTQSQLQTILAQFDLNKWTFTRNISIEEGAIPRSHPILTLNTRHLDNNDMLLATYLHEQLHWFIDGHKDESEIVAEELRRLHPNLATEVPNDSRGRDSTYLHLIICTLEYKALIQLLGFPKAKTTLEKRDINEQVYAIVLRDFEQLDAVLTNHSLQP